MARSMWLQGVGDGLLGVVLGPVRYLLGAEEGARLLRVSLDEHQFATVGPKPHHAAPNYRRHVYGGADKATSPYGSAASGNVISA